MSNSTPKVTVVVSVYNGEAYLRACLDSLVGQTLQDMEIIVVNDASTDGTMDIINEYTMQYPDRVRGIALPENLRQGGARNVGFRQARGTYLAYCDADDWVDATMYEKLYTLAQSGPYERTCCYYSKHHPDGREERKYAPRGWTSLILTDLVRKHGLYFPEKTLYEDILYIKLLDYYLSSTGIVPEQLYHYRVHQSSTTHALTSRVMEQRIAIEIKTLDELERRGLEHAPFSVATNAEFLSRGILRNCQAWLVKVGEDPRKDQLALLKDTVSTRLPDYRSALYYFSPADRFRLWVFFQLPWLFLPLAKIMLKLEKGKPWGQIPLGFCADRDSNNTKGD